MRDLVSAGNQAKMKVIGSGFQEEIYMKKLLAIITMASLSVMSLAACGSKATETTQEEATTTVTEARTTQAESLDEESSAIDTTAGESLVQTDAIDLSGSKYLSDGVLTVGLNSTFPPFEYIGDGTDTFEAITQNEGSVTGFDVALVNEIGSRLGVDVVIEDMDFDGLVPAIGVRIDCAASGMTITEEREEAVTFSDPYYNATQAVLVAVDSTISTAEDLADCEAIGVQSGTTGETVAREINDTAVVSVASFNQAVMDLVNGRSDAVVIDEVPGNAFVSQYSDDIKLLPGSQFDFDDEQYAIAMPQDDEILVAAINEAMAEIDADGTYETLVEEYISNYEAES